MEQSAFRYSCGQKILQSSNREIVAEDENAPMRETQAWPRGAEEDAPTSLDPVRPPVQRQLPTVPLDNSRHAALARTLQVGVVQLRNPSGRLKEACGPT
jgi:hypothetical protein